MGHTSSSFTHTTMKESRFCIESIKGISRRTPPRMPSRGTTITRLEKMNQTQPVPDAREEKQQHKTSKNDSKKNRMPARSAGCERRPAEDVIPFFVC
jgi:hypothetical protein